MMLIGPYRHLNSLFTPFFGDLVPRELREMNQLNLRVDIHETDEGYTLTADLPGLKKEDVHIDVKEDTLTISADVNTENKLEESGYICRERRSGHMERRFNLEGIDQEGITAAYENGVLTLKLPKAKPLPEDEARHIVID